VTGPPATRTWSPALLRWHLLLAHASFFAAASWTALRPAGLLGSVLHPEVLACVHLVTLGGVVTACLGAFHAVMPLAMGTRTAASWRDWFMLAAVQLAAVGVASHMALGTYGGVQWSALLLLVALCLQLQRWIEPVLLAKAPWSLRIGCLLAWTNLLLAVVLGGVLALQHTHPVLQVDLLQGLLAHSHLALGGFAGTLVAAVGIRLLPMFLPAHPPPAVLAAFAVLGLGAGGFLCGIGALVGDVLDAGLWLLAAGCCCWLAAAVAMVARRRPPPPSGLPRVLPSHVLIAAAVLSFATAILIGILLHGHQLGARWWGSYGAVLLLGGFGSLILGIGQRLLPLAFRVHTGRADAHRLPSPKLAWFTAIAWTAGLLMTPLALQADVPVLLSAAMSLLAAAVLADGCNLLARR
jgi:hypothetical protein